MEINRIFNQNCIEGMKLIDNGVIDLIITDPPYFIENLKNNLKESTLRRLSRNNIFHQNWDSNFGSKENYQKFIKEVLSEFKRILKPKGQVYMFFSYHHLDWGIQMIKELGFRFYKPLIWYKPDTMGVFPNQYGCNYEVILWFRNDNNGGKVTLNIGNGQRDVFMKNSTSIKERKDAGFHPTCKPKLIIRKLIQNGSNENDLILDPFMGSGTTAIACKEIKRNFIGFELSPEYISVALKRLKQENILRWF